MTTQYSINAKGLASLHEQYLDLTGHELLSGDDIAFHLETRQAGVNLGLNDQADYEVSGTNTLSGRPGFIILSDGDFDASEVEG
jgi:hypothetical protein